jgi:hypothetical protein
MASLDFSRATPLITLIAIILSVAALYFARAVLVPLALAVLIAFILSPVVAWLEKLHVGRVVSVAIRDGTPFAVCISAGPPCALSHIRSLFQDLKVKHPDISVLIGLWRFAGVAQRAAERIGLSAGDKIVTTLPEITQHIGILCEHAC